MRLELDNVELLYQQGTPFEVRALAGVSLVVKPGERLGIAGPVGSGKSSLLALMAGLEMPASGKVTHDGIVLGKKQRPVPGSVGLAFQSPENCLFEKTVFDDVAFAPRKLGLGEEACRRRVEQSLATVGLDAGAMAGRNPFSLSVGEQRRVALAGILAMEPEALLLDEPTAHLDPSTRSDLIDRLISLNQERSATIVLVGHDMDEMARFARRLVIIEAGRKIADGPATELLADFGLLSRCGLEPPGTVELCRLLAQATGTVVDPVFEEGEAVELLIELARCGEGG